MSRTNFVLCFNFKYTLLNVNYMSSNNYCTLFKVMLHLSQDYCTLSIDTIYITPT